MDDELYEIPIKGLTVDDCYFYHTMDLPGIGLIQANWDLRGTENQYLGNTNFSHTRVLEIGPASGALTVFMEKQGADVVAVEQPDDIIWDFVPFSMTNEEWETAKRRKARNNKRLKNSFWLTHEKMSLNAKVYYGPAKNLTSKLGKFDISTIGLVLTHTRDPISIIESCARLTTKKMIITERLSAHASKVDAPIVELLPKISLPKKRIGAWWYFSESFFVELLKIMGFKEITITHGKYLCLGKENPLTTFIAER